MRPYVKLFRPLVVTIFGFQPTVVTVRLMLWLSVCLSVTLVGYVMAKRLNGLSWSLVCGLPQNTATPYYMGSGSAHERETSNIGRVLDLEK